MTTVLATALAAYDAGACPIRGMTDGSKRPLGNWAEWQDHRPAREQIERWFSDGHPALGIVCGEISGRLECLEIEGRAMKPLWPPLKERMIEAGLLDLLTQAAGGYLEQSPSDGVHFLYRIGGDSEMPGNTKLASRVVPGVVQVESMIETRGEGGFIMVAPSNGSTHPTGKPWLMLRGGWDSVVTISRNQRDALVRICESFDEMPPMVVPPAPRVVATRTPGGSGWVDAALAEWDHANPIESVLDRNGWQYLESDGLGQLWRRPGKDRGSCSGRVNLNSRLHVFSTSTPFIAGQRRATTYDALDVELTYRLGRPPSSDERVVALRAETNQAPSDDYSWVTVTDRPAVAPPANQSDTNGAPSTAGVQHQEVVTESVALLPDEFWNSARWLSQIRVAAYSALEAPDAVFGAFSARYLTTIPKTLMLPRIISSQATFDYLSMLVAPSGGGKSGAMSIAEELMDLDYEQWPRLAFDLPPGSGEGLVDVMFENEEVKLDGKKVARQVQIFDGVHLLVDEGSLLTALADRKGSSIAQVLTTSWSGGVMGSTNIKSNRRLVRKGEARITATMGIQTALGAPLVGGFASTLGLTQRIVFYSLSDPALATVVQPEWPGALDVAYLNPNHWSARQTIAVHPVVADEIRARRREWKARPERHDPLDGHRYLCQLKQAAVFMFAEDRRELSPEDWECSRMVIDTSRRVRNTIDETARLSARKVAEIRASAKVGETIASADALTARAIHNGARAIARRVARDDQPVKQRDLHNATSSQDRKVGGFEAILDHAITLRWVVDNTDGTFGRGDAMPT